MEPPLSATEIRRIKLSKMQRPPPPPGRKLAAPSKVKAPPYDQAKLAAIAMDLNIRLRSAEMPGAMQERAFRCTRAILDANLDNKATPTLIAMRLKKEFDAVYGPAWHCIVGKSFGSFVTHSSGGFVYFSVDKLSFLLFKTEVKPVKRSPRLPPLLKLNINQ
ncbi:uncharacterized protein LOC126674713 [Mercurialis annua]|uniref:uncharacterized protein LOC126674713 n=1 Tax=Mercurialis annua TaxID=3986 RepID=UPI00215F58DA|nr:uncharacterized protein LOC126674713 [Mercurialis annua]